MTDERATEGLDGFAGRRLPTADYAALAKEAQGLAQSRRRKAGAKAGGDAATELRAQVARLRKRLAEIAAIDFFGAIGRERAEELLGGLEAQLDKDAPVAGKTSTDPNVLETLRNRTWVTREGVYADRIASASLAAGTRRLMIAATRAASGNPIQW